MNIVKIDIHVFRGSEDNSQYAAFTTAVKNIEERCVERIQMNIMYLSTKQLRNSQWTPFQFVDWLQSCNYHFILGHAHQSIPEWNGYDLVSAYEYLRNTKHPGFPSGDLLNCPILTQDKNKYLKGIN